MATCLLTGELFLNHIAIRTVAANLNNDLAKLINGKVAGQLRRKERECILQLESSINATCRQIAVRLLQNGTDDPGNTTRALACLLIARTIAENGMQPTRYRGSS